MSAVKAAIVGGAGYTGLELLRLLAGHPRVDVAAVTSRSLAGTAVVDLFPSLRGHYKLNFCEPDIDQLSACELVFFATPHGVAKAQVPELIARDVRVIDLSADFRLRDARVWAHWYGQPHNCPELLSQAVYGLPEVNRTAIRHAQLLACPGCYPTAIQLGFIPLLEAGLIEPGKLIANAASGSSGAGRQGKTELLFAENSDNFRAYAASGHRHLPEIEQGLRAVQRSDTPPAQLTFVPHLLPTVRGIHATLYAPIQTSLCDKLDQAALQALFEQRYSDEPFVEILAAGEHPQTRSVRGTNMCQIAVTKPQHRDILVVMSVIDNLAKGASAQAVQNMNIMFGFAETEGLRSPALVP